MANHIKPSKEELKANAEAAAQALENNPPVPSPSTPIPSPSQPIPSPSAPVPSPSTPIPSPSEPAPSPDYKKRYSDSSREAQVLASKNRDINKAVDEAASLPDPTEEELIKEYPEFEDMTSTEQRFAKENFINKRRFELINAATQKYKKVDEWQEKVNAFVDDPKNIVNNPDLDGKEDDFKVFASKPSRVGVDFSDLILAFVGEASKNKPAPKKGKMFEVGSGGPNTTPKPNDGKVSVEEAKALRETNYPKYKELLLAGKIKNE